jgi:hypothetical protein
MVDLELLYNMVREKSYHDFLLSNQYRDAVFIERILWGDFFSMNENNQIWVSNNNSIFSNVKCVSK